VGGVGKRDALQLTRIELERDVIADHVLDDLAAIHRAIPGDYGALYRSRGLAGNRPGADLGRRQCGHCGKNSGEEHPPHAKAS
jgi:hypothetical protein